MRVSVVIPTKDRLMDLNELLISLSQQKYIPHEVIIINDGTKDISRLLSDSFENLKSKGCTVIYLNGPRKGLTTARNIGVRKASGDVILFLDDDVLLPSDLILKIVTFLNNHPEAVGVQPMIITTKKDYSFGNPILNAIRKALMINYFKKDTMAVRRSGASIFPLPLTKTIKAQRLMGCCFCLRKDVFNKFNVYFDENLVRWGYGEDLDLTYRLYKKGGSLYISSCQSYT